MKSVNCIIGCLLLSSFTCWGAKNTWNISGNTYEVDTLIQKHLVGPGTTLAKYNLPSFPLKLSVMEMDLTNPYVEFETCKGGDRGVCEEKPTTMYTRNDYPGHDMIGATNGDFYFYQNVVENGIPRSGQFKKNECITNPVGRGVFVLTDERKPYIDKVDFAGVVKFGEVTTRLHTVNMQRLEWENTNGNQLNLYTNAYGTETENCSGGTKVIITPADTPFFWSANKDIVGRVESIVDGTGVTQIPEGKAVLWGRGTSEEFLKTLSVGSEITLNLGTNLRSQPGLLKDFKELMGGSNHIVLKDGSAFEGDDSRNPRTLIGMNKERNKLYFVVIDGRSSSSAGVTLSEAPGVFLGLGAWDAVNLDGGGSSVMITNGEIMNTPSDGPVRAVGNGCLIYSKAPIDDEIGLIQFAPRSFNLPVGAKIKPIIYGYNQYGVLKNKSLENVTLTCDEKIGHITEDGYFIASSNVGAGLITAKYNGVSVAQEIILLPATLSLKLNSVVVDKYKPYNIEIIGECEGYTDLLDPNILTWSSNDNTGCVVENGVIKGLKDGTYIITGKNDTFSCEVAVAVENPTKREAPIQPSLDPTLWKVAQTGGKNTTLSQFGEGMKISYTGASGRGPNIKLTQKITLWGLPDMIRLEFNPTEAPITKVNLSLNNGYGNNTIKAIEYVKDSEGKTIIEIPTADWCDVTDRGNFPISINYIQMEMGTSTTGTEYSIEIPRFETIYENMPAGVGSIIYSDLDASLYPNPVKAGNSAYLKVGENMENVKIAIYTTNGQLLNINSSKANSGLIELPVQSLSRGLYIVKLSTTKGSKSIKMIIE